MFNFYAIWSWNGVFHFMKQSERYFFIEICLLWPDSFDPFKQSDDFDVNAFAGLKSGFASIN